MILSGEFWNSVSIASGTSSGSKFARNHQTPCYRGCKGVIASVKANRDRFAQLIQAVPAISTRTGLLCEFSTRRASKNTPFRAVFIHFDFLTDALFFFGRFAPMK